jgi:predicted ATPase
MAAELEVIYGRARELCDKVTDTPHRFTVLRGLWNSAFLRKPLPQAQDQSAELVTLANAQDDDTRRALAHRARGSSLLMRGEFESCWESFRLAIDLWDVDKARAEILVYGEDPSVLCQAYGSLAMWYLGYLDKSHVLMRKALDDAERLSKPFIQTFIFSLASTLHVLRNQFPQAIECADASLAICVKHGFPQWAAQSVFVRGRARAALGRADDGIAEMEQGFADWRALGGKVASTRNSVWLAEACREAGRIAAGLDWINTAADHVRTFDERDQEAELYRVHGQLLLAGTPGEAEECLRRSIEIARRQRAKSFELRTAMVLAQLWQHQGRRQAAYDLLAPIFGWFSEGFDTPDLQKAKALLDDLA